MLTIRQDQLAVFSQLEVQRFEEWMVVHLKKFFPQRCRAAGTAEIRELVRYGIERAEAHGFTAKREACKYIDLMMVFGRDFDNDPRFPWASSILSKKRLPAPKMQSLQGAAQKHLKAS